MDVTMETRSFAEQDTAGRAQEPSAASRFAADNARPIRVLLVEDDEDDQILIRDMLSQIDVARYELEWVENWPCALAKLENDAFDVCLVDYHLGQYTGLDFLKHLTEHRPDTPGILLTGLGDRAVDLQAMEAGAADFLTKGRLTPDLLEHAIRYSMERHRLVRDLRASYERAKELAIHDELTGLFNRRHFMERLAVATAGARRRGVPLTLGICDIDNFKRINDQHGHLLGDEVLRVFAGVLARQLRSEDVVGRYGGDEFCILFSFTNEHDVGGALARIRKALEGTCVSAGSGAFVQVTASFGLAEFAHDDTPLSLLERADRALYVCKRSRPAASVAPAVHPG